MLDESKFLELYNRHQESGLNIKEFCSNEGVKESTYYYWRKKLQKARIIKDFIPLILKSSPAVPTQSHQSSQACEHINDDILLELVYPNGTKLRVKKDIDLSRLRALIYL